MSENNKLVQQYQEELLEEALSNQQRSFQKVSQA
jgi:hypothetical protein